MTREQLIGVLSSSANLMEEREDIIDYIKTLEVGKGLNEHEIREGYQQFKAENPNRDNQHCTEKWFDHNDITTIYRKHFKPNDF